MTISEITNAFKDGKVLKTDGSDMVTETGYRAVLALTTALNNGWVIVEDWEVNNCNECRFGNMSGI